ncbi:MAG: SRPBCC domain-containing protein [Bryobacteraceae bacterium]
MKLKFEVQAVIHKRRSEVFDAVYDPAKLSRYFTTAGASAPLRRGEEVIWKFADYPGDIRVRVLNTTPGERIAFEWDAEDGPYRTRVDIGFETLGEGRTRVSISERGWHETQEALDASYSNCHGWTQMLCCLKAYLEHGVNLREGFYS